MRIELENNYVVKRLDDNNLVLCQVVERTKKDTNEKYQDDKVIGYYQSIQSALKGYVKYSTRLSDYTDIKQVLEHLDSIHNEIANLKTVEAI